MSESLGLTAYVRFFHQREPKWVLAEGKRDHRGKPQILCRRDDLEFCFRQGRRQGCHVWLCYRRRNLFVGYTLEEVGRREGEEAVKAASEFLGSIEPSFDVVFSADQCSI